MVARVESWMRTAALLHGRMDWNGAGCGCEVVCSLHACVSAVVVVGHGTPVALCTDSRAEPLQVWCSAGSLVRWVLHYGAAGCSAHTALTALDAVS
jgi:hypothetical protein